MTACTYRLSALHPQHPPPSAFVLEVQVQALMRRTCPCLPPRYRINRFSAGTITHNARGAVHWIRLLFSCHVIFPNMNHSWYSRTCTVYTGLNICLLPPGWYWKGDGEVKQTCHLVEGLTKTQSHLLGIDTNRCVSRKTKKPPPMLGLCFPPEKTCPWLKRCVFATYKTFCSSSIRAEDEL